MLALLLVAAAFFAEVHAAVDGLLVQRQDTPTPSNPAPSPSLTPSPSLVFIFENFQAQTCGSASFLWYYNGPDDLVSLVATNDGVLQNYPIPPLVSSTSFTRPVPTFSNINNDDNANTLQRRAVPTGAITPEAEDGPLTVTLATSVDPASLEYKWSVINVPPGWYILQADMPTKSFKASSDPFYVHPPRDGVRCQVLAPPPASASSGSPATPSSSGTALPIGGTGTRFNLGAILGISIGVVIAVAFALLAWLCLFRKSVRGGRRRDDGTYPSMTRGWSGLGSTDSRNALGMGATGTNRSGGNASGTREAGHRPHADSVGTVLMSPSEEAMALEKDYNAKDPSSPTYGLPVLNHNQTSQEPPQSPQRGRGAGVGRTYSATSSVTMNDYSPPPPPNGRGPLRRPSVPESIGNNRVMMQPHASGSRQSIDSIGQIFVGGAAGGGQRHSARDDVGYPPTSPSPYASPYGNPPGLYANKRVSSSVGAHADSVPSSPVSPTHSGATHGPPGLATARPVASPDPVKQANRQSFGKKRKPVPVYNPSEEDSSSTSLPDRNSAASPVTPLPQNQSLSSQSQSQQPRAQSRTHQTTNYSASNSASPSPVPGSGPDGLYPNGAAGASGSGSNVALAQGHYVTRNRSLQDMGVSGSPGSASALGGGVGGAGSRPELHHENSFGEKQVHYLIPDMPMPQKE